MGDCWYTLKWYLFAHKKAPLNAVCKSDALPVSFTVRTIWNWALRKPILVATIEADIKSDESELTLWYLWQCGELEVNRQTLTTALCWDELRWIEMSYCLKALYERTGTKICPLHRPVAILPTPLEYQNLLCRTLLLRPLHVGSRSATLCSPLQRNLSHRAKWQSVYLDHLLDLHWVYPWALCTKL